MSTPQKPSPALVRACLKECDLTDEEFTAFYTAGAIEDAKKCDILRAHIAATAQAMREEDCTISEAELLHRWADRLEGKNP